LHLTASAAALSAVSRIAWAQTYPSRPVRIIVGFPAGISADVIARLLAQSLSERLGQSFIIENRPGAASAIGTEIVVKAAPDGYTLLATTTSNTISAALYTDLNYDFIHDTAPVAGFAHGASVMVATPSLSSQTVPEFIAYAKAHPGKVSYASTGIGSPSHVFGELFKMMAGVDLLHVPYRGNYYADAISGQVDVLFSPTSGVIGYLRAGKLRALAVTSPTRLDALPDIPALSEFLPGYEASIWEGLCAPKNTPTEFIEVLNETVNAIAVDPDMKARLADLGLEPMPMTPAEFGKFIADEAAKWAKVIKFAGVKADRG
jgi:tripartite-type tricarboxylate transporter receptor subunit TctC